MADASISEHDLFDNMNLNWLKFPLFKVGGLWVNALENTTASLQAFFSKRPDISSPWTYIIILIGCIVLYYLYQLVFRPFSRVRRLGDLGYISEEGLSKQEIVSQVKKQRTVGKIPPVYPNGWFAILESRDLEKGQVKNVTCLGLNLAVFRGEDGRAHAVDTYCPHLGANLAIGGRVFGNCLECPFHGWRFRGDDGKCVHIPCADKIPDVAKVKSYIILEMNGAIMLWFHAEGLEPYWTPPEIEEISSGQWGYRGRTEHFVNSHIEEIPENGADLAHLPQVHQSFIAAGVHLAKMQSPWWNFGWHEWDAGWEQHPEPEGHMGSLKLRHKLKIFGLEMPFVSMTVTATQIGPGLVYLMWNSMFGRGSFIHTVLPVEPMVQRVIHQVYMNWWVPPIIAKGFLIGEAVMFERDIMVWNNKRYLDKPVFVKSKEDQMLAKHRRWYSQFYSENSPRLKIQTETLDW